MLTQVQEISVDTGDHVVQFYERDSDLVQTVGAYLVAAVRAGEAAVVIATEAHRRAFEAYVEAAAGDLAAVRRDARFTSLDAAATMAQFMRDGRIDEAAFRQVIGGVVREAAAGGRPVRAYGEMVALLWDAGDVGAAIDLETLWNELGRELPFSLFCAYHSASLAGDEHREALQQLCHLHSAVVEPSTTSRAEATGHFDAELGAPRAARHFLVEVLRQWGIEGGVADDAQLVLTELATNAVLHARSSFSVDVQAEDACLRIAVRDASTTRPLAREASTTAPSGRGLQLIAAVSDDWGVDVTASGKLVWAVLPARHAGRHIKPAR
jgi:anti-sigma regulatory factor (Ser/Thr protein kinase)